MGLMSEDNIYPVVSKLFKPKKGYFIYTVWYHSFDETEHYQKNQSIETYISDALTFLNYLIYFSTTNKKESKTNRFRKYLEEISKKYGLKLKSCTIHIHRTPLSFDLDFMLMTPNWLIQYLETNRSNQYDDIDLIRERIIEKIRQSIEGIFIEIPVVNIIVSRV